MDKEVRELEEREVIVEEKPPFEPSPRWKRIGAWVLFAIVILGVINWLVSIAFPNWPQYVMELFR